MSVGITHEIDLKPSKRMIAWLNYNSANRQFTFPGNLAKLSSDKLGNGQDHSKTNLKEYEAEKEDNTEYYFSTPLFICALRWESFLQVRDYCYVHSKFKKLGWPGGGGAHL